MSANARWKRLPWLAVTVAVALAAVLLVLSLRGEPEAPVDTAPVARAPAPQPSGSAPPPAVAASPVPGAPSGGSAVADLLRPQEPEPPSGDSAPAPVVDLEALRAKLPDNLYWEVGAPTRDAEVLKKRDEDARRWNDLYGKVLSGLATEAEVRQYYAYRRQLSEDYLTFASTVLTEYGDRLPEQERGLYELSISMHRTRLAEIPGQEKDALARRETQEQRREAWRRGRQEP